MPLENWPLFLAQLRQINDWLAHQDANFHQLKGTVGGDSESVSQLINSFSVLEEELRLQRFQVEDLLDRGQIFMRDQLSEGKYGFSTESEGKVMDNKWTPLFPLSTSRMQQFFLFLNCLLFPTNK
ncbi:unnamed protein product [Hydatigera taeniaeformis]|uniref:Signal transducer and activator of transcription n=1 Tax=Hydatigena taeniaeformis TaxID=6205 RepID=A0A0R3WY68_HYDTA|nr:unnamed protein product [Hydatigera taeniaeformis]